jgi:putative transposase
MVLRYIEGNPVRADLVTSAIYWMWSSHGEVIGKRPKLMIDSPPIELPRNWDRYVNEPLTEKELERVRCSIGRQSPYGDSRWQVEISKRLGLESFGLLIPNNLRSS